MRKSGTEVWEYRFRSKSEQGNPQRPEIARVHTLEPDSHQFFQPRDFHCLAIADPLKRQSRRNPHLRDSRRGLEPLGRRLVKQCGLLGRPVGAYRKIHGHGDHVFDADAGVESLELEQASEKEKSARDQHQ